MTYSNLLSEYNNIIPEEHRKKYSQFFTPIHIANLMCQWVCREGELEILDPALGLGIFAEEAFKLNNSITFVSFEKDDIVFSYASTYKNKIIRKGKDYLLEDWEHKYDGILCNPPYFKFHNYENKKYLKYISENVKVKLSGYSNIYVLFLIKSLCQLKKQGRMAYIIPSEFMNANYGVAIKEYLLKSKMLRHVFVFNSEFSVFDNAITTTAILFFANDENSDEISFSTISDSSELRKIEDFIMSYKNYRGDFYYSINSIDPNEKWENLYSRKENMYSNLVPFSKFAKVKRGIATGANDFFVFNKEKIKKTGIPEKYFDICLCKSNYIHSSFLDDDIVYNLKKYNCDIYLLNISNDLDFRLNKYIKNGERKGYNLRYLTRNRSPWYSMEKKEISPILVSVFNRNKVKFIRNDANVSNLTTFHSLYPTRTHMDDINLLFAYLLTDTAKDLLEYNKRTYGNGLNKFEPNDINKSLIVDLDIIPRVEKMEIIELLDKYRLSREDKIYLDKIDAIIKNRFLHSKEK